ncbi:uncharacterized protein LOC126659741 [Mercurialis annua]|uniref:uncharacterized protein LOC126659741 n=1 Tax=Mercurialis annua TaxID=3986 RepID=UPI00215E147A|nr:uncharacterized protein LOC126659741 [Mercurialis annua]
MAPLCVSKFLNAVANCDVVCYKALFESQTKIRPVPCGSFEKTMAFPKSDEEEEIGNSIAKLSADLDDKNEKKINLLNQLKPLREAADEAVQILLPILQSLQVSEKQESDAEASYIAKKSKLEAEVYELENKCASYDLDYAIAHSTKILDSLKKELACRLRDVMSVKRQIDDVSTQPELIQYERRLSELNAHIQEKHRQTRKYYATYNALLEIKEMMLKETSLLNSISSQFQDAIASTDGRMKLINSMEGIVKGSQQKLQKVQVGLQEEQKACDALKKRYAAAIAEQRHYYSLKKDFQEECAKNERLKSPKSV